MCGFRGPHAQCPLPKPRSALPMQREESLARQACPASSVRFLISYRAAPSGPQGGLGRHPSAVTNPVWTKYHAEIKSTATQRQDWFSPSPHDPVRLSGTVHQRAGFIEGDPLMQCGCKGGVLLTLSQRQRFPCRLYRFGKLAVLGLGCRRVLFDKFGRVITSSGICDAQVGAQTVGALNQKLDGREFGRRRLIP